MDNKPNWKWDDSVNVRDKKCAGCNKSMFYDIHHAIVYQNKTWHLHCLLDTLTETPQINLFDSSYNAP